MRKRVRRKAWGLRRDEAAEALSLLFPGSRACLFVPTQSRPQSSSLSRMTEGEKSSGEP